MNRVVPMQFHWDFDEAELLGMKNLQIRALLIFATPEFEQLSIKRCPIHIIQDKFCGVYYFSNIYIENIF